MATRATASAVFPIPIDELWKTFRDFSAVPRHFPGVSDVGLVGEGGPHSVGITRVIKWKSGEEIRQQLIELSDQFKVISWETVGANFENDASATITTIRLFRITETKETLVEWSADFAADVSAKTVLIEQKNYLQNLKDLRSALSKK